MKRWFRTPLLLLLLLAALSTPALAQATAKSTSGGGAPRIGWNGWGVSVGLSDNPDQVYGGVHFDLGEFARNVRFRPNIELGVGDHATLIQANAEATYLFSKVQVWKPYVGGSIGFSWVSIDSSRLPPGADNTDTDISLMGVGGIETKLKSSTKFFLEAKVGIGDDDPDFKVAAGWSWK